MVLTGKKKKSLVLVLFHLLHNDILSLIPSGLSHNLISDYKDKKTHDITLYIVLVYAHEVLHVQVLIL